MFIQTKTSIFHIDNHLNHSTCYYIFLSSPSLFFFSLSKQSVKFVKCSKEKSSFQVQNPYPKKTKKLCLIITSGWKMNVLPTGYKHTALYFILRSSVHFAWDKSPVKQHLYKLFVMMNRVGF